MAEFLLKISTIDLYHISQCKLAVADLISLAKAIEDCITEENELDYFMSILDTQGRTVLSIIAINGFYKLLENHDVGSIINNMWIGKRKNHGILEASTLYSSFFASPDSEEKLSFLDKMDSRKSYMFQYEQLISSCKMRFFAQMVSIAFLVLFYTLMMHLAASNDSLDDFAADPHTEIFLRLSQI